jgi:hypothetical protein
MMQAREIMDKQWAMVIVLLVLAVVGGVAVPVLAGDPYGGAYRGTKSPARQAEPVEPGTAPPFGSVAVQGVPLLAVVMGLVEMAKAMGVEKKALTLVSMGIGLALGVAYMLSLGFPTDYAGWFGVAVYGLGLGLVASGLYKVGEGWARKASV